ncbi:hypothetical protein EDC04DRAFT_1284697 [Pisolithus marmoratus]|nr:hypothetical protein EDC04DRAFT_1284697 [Pisolithus marmoratus]
MWRCCWGPWPVLIVIVFQGVAISVCKEHHVPLYGSLSRRRLCFLLSFVCDMGGEHRMEAEFTKLQEIAPNGFGMCLVVCTTRSQVIMSCTYLHLALANSRRHDTSHPFRADNRGEGVMWTGRNEGLFLASFNVER